MTRHLHHPNSGFWISSHYGIAYFPPPSPLWKCILPAAQPIFRDRDNPAFLVCSSKLPKQDQFFQENFCHFFPSDSSPEFGQRVSLHTSATVCQPSLTCTMLALKLSSGIIWARSKELHQRSSYPRKELHSKDFIRGVPIPEKNFIRTSFKRTSSEESLSQNSAGWLPNLKI